MSRTAIIDLEQFKKGFYKLDDTTKAPYATARIMRNAQVTDRGGIAPREGTTLLGTESADSETATTLFNFRKSFNTDEFLIRTVDSKIEIFSKNHEDTGWSVLKDGLESGKEFGFVTSLVNKQNQDYLLGCNRFDNFFSWSGSMTALDGALSGGETELTVDSTLEDEVFESQTATSSSTTTLVVTNAGWAPSQWNNLYVRITSGASQGKVSKITDTTYDTITFETITGLTGTPTFEVRKIKFPTAQVVGTTIAFVDSDPDTITDTDNGFILAGFRKGMKISVAGTVSNDGNYTIADVAAGTLTLIPSDTLITEAAGSSFTITELPSVIYAGTEIQYTPITEDTKIPVASAHAGADDALVMQATVEHPDNPRGNRMTNYLTRTIVGNVRSGKAYNEGGALQGYAAAGSYFVSQSNNPIDFDFSATRVAGEGDIVSAPWGGGDITDISQFEGTPYIFKRDYIEAFEYSQEGSDIITRTPIKHNIGSVGKTIKGSDDIYFMTPDKRFTSIGRVAAKDATPQTVNIGHPIKRYLDTVNVDGLGRGVEFQDRILVPLKSSTKATDNDTILVYSKKNNAFEGIWELGATDLATFNEKVYMASSTGPDVFQLYNGQGADIVGEERYPIISEYATHFINLTASNFHTQAMNGFSVEGYALPGTMITFNLFKDHSNIPFFTLECDFNEESGIFDGIRMSAHLGRYPLAIAPTGALAERDLAEDGMRHFMFRVYFPHTYGNHFSVGHMSAGVDCRYEITRYGLMLKEDPVVNQNRINC